MSYGDSAPARIVAVQSKVLTGTTANFAAFNARTKRVRITTSLGAYWHMTGTPTATATTGYLPANASMEFDVNPAHLIACLQFATGGNMTVYELDW
jgi:hypothetical protein